MVTDPNFLLYPDLYYFTYEYGNGDSYSGYGYAASGTYYIGQVLNNYSNETGNYGSYTINSVQTTYDGYGIEGEVYVTSYYNGETDYLASWDYDDINAYSNLGLGYEYGYFYSDYFSNYDEADLVITNATTLTLPSIFVSPKGGDIVGEGETQVFEIKLSNPYDQQILIQYKVKDWTASTDFYYGDFDGFSASFLTFDPGELVKEVYISIKDDLTDEDEEKYIFELYSASEGTYSLIPEEIQVVGRITDNDDSPSSLNITSLNPLGTPENPIIIPVDNSDITWIDIDFSYDNQSNEFIWIFSDGTGSTYSLGSSTYDTDNNDETNLGLLPKSGFNQQGISRGEPGEITAVSLFMQQQLVNGGYGNVLKEVTLPVNYIFVDDIDLAVTKLPIMNSLAEAGEEFTYTITISNDYSFYPGKIFLTEILPKGVIFVNSDIGPVYLEKDGDKTHLTFAFDNYSLSGSLIGTITVIPSKESRPIDNDFSQSGWTIETETHLRSGEIYINDPDLSNNSIIQEIQVFDPDFINDDTTSLPSITLAVSPASVLENGTSNLVYTFTRTGATTNALTVNYSVAGTADNTDYTGTTTGTGKTVTFAAGSPTATLTIDPAADTTVENDETVTLTLVAGTDYTIDTTSAVTGTIANSSVDDFSVLINFDNFNSVNGLNFNGDAEQVGSIIRLVPAVEGHTAGSVFFANPVNLDTQTSFETFFQFEFNNPGGISGGADGLVFVIQNNPSQDNALGATGGALGYEGISSSVGVEFDIFNNLGIDPNDNHIGINTSGSGNSLVTAIPSFNFKNGDLINTWIEYDGASNLLEVFVATSEPQPNEPILSETLDLTSFIGNQGFVGFTASKAAGFADHDLISWEFSSNSEIIAAHTSFPSLLRGTPQNDSLDATTGQYTVIPYTGDDTIVVNTASDVILELPNEGTDTIVSSVNYNLAAQTHIENLTLTGTDDITGIGNRKNNVITGNSGQNVLVGLQGDDTFVFNFGDSTIAKPDRIRDFGVGADRIQVGDQLLPTDLPSATYDVRTLEELVNSVFTDSSSASGLQTLEINSAALGTYTSFGVTNTYLIANDGIPGFNTETDLIINIARIANDRLVSYL